MPGPPHDLDAGQRRLLALRTPELVALRPCLSRHLDSATRRASVRTRVGLVALLLSAEAILVMAIRVLVEQVLAVLALPLAGATNVVWLLLAPFW